MSLVSSLLAVALFTALYITARPLFGPASNIIKASGWFLALNWVFDYVALLGSRVMLRFMVKSRGPTLILWMLLSFLTTFIIATNAALMTPVDLGVREPKIAPICAHDWPNHLALPH
jgi:hypothetical protein